MHVRMLYVFGLHDGGHARMYVGSVQLKEGGEGTPAAIDSEARTAYLQGVLDGLGTVA